ncbi:hypothetical protein SAMN05518672_103263 [Chitinophaga sp. CF118]|uniref:hypothetical protein n=1 Tax=Chitinophaga sp. CF118 TaxID=1884367 RepID=UPI0008E0415B|nr:hypothetical protein [Chitinophaga sp. CF118]SFD79978.1 hypothetical protein SAMN05518672_103263 [Chitinophaga sp. CF118]
MAKAIGNLLTLGLSGTIGNMTFSQRGRDTVVSRKRGSSKVPATESQLDNQDKFKEAQMYAKAAINDPVIKAMYKAHANPGQSAYNVAFSDASKAPEILFIDTSDYHGQRGDIIIIKADNFLVLLMKVVIRNAAGVLIEEGEALAPVNGKSWKYKVTTQNDVLKGSKIIITAINRPGKQTLREEVITGC